MAKAKTKTLKKSKPPKPKATTNGKRDVPVEKLRKFVEAYMASANGAASAKAAGYGGGVKARSEQARRLLERPDVREMMEARVAEDPAVLTRKERQALWSSIARGDEFKQMTFEGVVKGPPPFGARIQALRDLARSQGDFVERTELNISGRVEVVARMPERDAPPDPDA